ncbi:Arc family DNA-binding protein [Escherichia coli]|nr:Arc family DNA-binding protein [Escherichia coli]EGZ0277746.1 Arc family DNA-binding protein [Escherichia coli]EGZ1302548.1 Arc family DNA-binding protein [Escherichia coli]EGZ1448912.1 Arc family DNA-binding protein [Escherichia coli]EGZ1774641.1 Arc family DNA-binding protein [Escherichia coli]
MAKGVSISPTTVRIPESLREALAVRASKNGRSLNSEIVMILQAAIDEEKSPRSIEGFAQQESEKFREALLKTLSSMYGEDKKPT